MECKTVHRKQGLVNYKVANTCVIHKKDVKV